MSQQALTKSALKQKLGITSNGPLITICNRLGINYQPGHMLFTPAEVNQILGQHQNNQKHGN